MGIGKLEQRMIFLVSLEDVLSREEAASLAFKGDNQ
jgi:hypothetical protein